jgi:hypothetical protein
MNSTAASVIKNDEVRVAGKVRLGSAVSHAPASHGSPVTAAGPQHTAAPAARIVRTAPDHVMIEVTCGCGTRTVLKCNF